MNSARDQALNTYFLQGLLLHYKLFASAAASIRNSLLYKILDYRRPWSHSHCSTTNDLVLKYLAALGLLVTGRVIILRLITKENDTNSGHSIKAVIVIISKMNK